MNRFNFAIAALCVCAIATALAFLLSNGKDDPRIPSLERDVAHRQAAPTERQNPAIAPTTSAERDNSQLDELSQRVAEIAASQRRIETQLSNLKEWLYRNKKAPLTVPERQAIRTKLNALMRTQEQKSENANIEVKRLQATLSVPEDISTRPPSSLSGDRRFEIYRPYIQARFKAANEEEMLKLIVRRLNEEDIAMTLNE